MNIHEKQQQRLQFLNKLYQKVDGKRFEGANIYEIGKELNFDKETVHAIVNYLFGENLVESRTQDGGISIGHLGIKEIEEALSNPERPTEHFPSINTIVNYGVINNPAIQQGNSNSNQTININSQEQISLTKILQQLENIKGELKSNEEDYLVLLAEIETLKAQNNSPKPKRIIITESLKTIRTLIEGVSVNALSPGLLEMINGLL